MKFIPRFYQYTLACSQYIISDGLPLPMFRPQVTLKCQFCYRILNVGQLAPLELLIVDGDENIAPCDFREIARDGVYYDKPVAPKGGQSVVHPGNRLDWLIKCTEIGTFKVGVYNTIYIFLDKICVDIYIFLSKYARCHTCCF